MQYHGHHVSSPVTTALHVHHGPSNRTLVMVRAVAQSAPRSLYGAVTPLVTIPAVSSATALDVVVRTRAGLWSKHHSVTAADTWSWLSEHSVTAAVTSARRAAFRWSSFWVVLWFCSGF